MTFVKGYRAASVLVALLIASALRETPITVLEFVVCGVIGFVFLLVDCYELGLLAGPTPTQHKET